MKATPVIGAAPALLSVTVSVEGVFTPVIGGVNETATPGCAITLSVADAPVAVPAFVVVTAPVEFR